MINKLNYGKVNGDSEELHALKGFKVLAVGNGTIGEECALSIMLMNENNVAVDLSITEDGAYLSDFYALTEDMIPYPIAKQVARIGNSVVPIMAEKLVEANCPYLKVGERMPNMNIDDTEEQLRFA